MKIRDLVNFDMLFPNMQRKIYLRDLVFGAEVGKRKRADVYLEVRKRSGHIFFE
jgi:hypothetical protein